MNETNQIAQVVEGLRRFAETLFGPALQQVGEIGGDWARLWRLRNLVTISEKMNRILEAKGIMPEHRRYLALSVGLPMLEKASYQDDDYLQEKWANLMASSIAPNEKLLEGFSLDTTYIEILGQFSRLDCEALEFVVEHGIADRDEAGNLLANPLEIEQVKDYLDSPYVHISLEKLEALGCVSRNYRIPLQSGGPNGLAEVFTPTLIGINLFVVSSGANPQWFKEENH